MLYIEQETVSLERLWQQKLRGTVYNFLFVVLCTHEVITHIWMQICRNNLFSQENYQLAAFQRLGTWKERMGKALISRICLTCIINIHTSMISFNTSRMVLNMNVGRDVVSG